MRRFPNTIRTIVMIAGAALVYLFLKHATVAILNWALAASIVSTLGFSILADVKARKRW